MPSIWFRAYRAFRIKVLGEPAWLYETPFEMVKRLDAYCNRPEVLERVRNHPPSAIYNRTTGKLTRIERD